MKIKRLTIGQVGTIQVNIPYLEIGSGSPRGVIMAVQHGGELSPLWVIKKILAKQKFLKGTAVIVPIINIFGMLFSSRNEAIEGKDLNRSFPGNPSGDFTSRLALAITSLCKKADFVIDLHTFSRQTPIIAGFTLDKTKNQTKLFAMTTFFSPEAIWIVDRKRKEDQRFFGTLDESLNKIGISSIFIEMPNYQSVSDKQISKICDGILNIFRLWKKPFSSSAFAKIPKFTATYFYSDLSGLFEPKVKPMTKIKKGQMIGTTTILPSYLTIPIKSPKGGVVLTIKGRDVVRTGTKLLSIGTEIDL